MGCSIYYDFSGMTIWQAYLPDAQLHNVDFTGALMEKSVFAQTFGSSPDKACITYRSARSNWSSN